MKLKNLSHRFLESLAETVDVLNAGIRITPFNPTTAVLSALILTGTAAFSYGFKLPVLIFAVSLALVLVTRSPVDAWAKMLLFILAWTAVVVIPLPFITPGTPLANLSFSLIELRVSREGLSLMVTFTSRAVASAAVFTSFASVMGWERILRGLEGIRMPHELTALLSLTVMHISLFLREASKMLLAREARIVRKVRFEDAWGILSTVVGDLLLRSYERAWRLEKAMRARSFTSKGLLLKPSATNVGIKDFLLLSFTLCILALGVLGGL